MQPHPLPSRLRRYAAGTPLRLYVLLLVLTALPVALFSVYADRVWRQEAEKQALAQSAQMASLSALFLEDHFGQSIALLESYAINPDFRDAWVKRDLAAVSMHMERARRQNPEAALVSVYDVDGTMRAIAPHDPSVIGRNYQYRDWYKGLLKHWKPYVSEVYRTTAAPQQLAVAVSIPIKDESGQPIGIIAAAYSLERISQWLKQVNDYGSTTISVVDQNGRLLANPAIDVFAPPVDLSGYAPVQRVRSGEANVGVFGSGDKEMMVAYVPIPSFGWGVIAEQPAALVRAQIWEIRRNVLLFAAGFVLMAVLSATLVARLYRRQRRLVEEVESLTMSEARYRSLIQGATYGIYRSNERGFVSANPALVKMLGYDSEEDLLRVDVARDVYGSTEERARVMQAFREGKAIDGIEVRWKKKDGTPVTVRLSGRAVREESGELSGFETIVEDVTERRALEEQLRQSQRLEAVGRLAGGIAHDFNNLLTVITGYCQLAIDELGNRHPLHVELEEVKKAADRAATLTRQLLAFSRQQVMAAKVLDLNAVIHNMDSMLRRLIGEDVELVTALSKDLGNVRADAGQIEQVIMNLAVNARDAMPQGGKLTIQTANISADDTYAREHLSMKPGEYVMIAVSDSGFGMDEETRAHIFEPFFTTKLHGRGTGLGLSTVYGIVKQSGGFIWVYSELGFGTTFKIYLPRVHDALETAEPRGARTAYRGTETILLVEDEDGVRSLARDVLERHGYRVIEARGGSEAIEACLNYQGEVHLLLTDVIMQQMSGRELAEKLSATWPKLKLVYMSGYTDDAILRHGVLAEGTAFLQKPFTTESLTKKVREVLDAGVSDVESKLTN